MYIRDTTDTMAYIGPEEYHFSFNLKEKSSHFAHTVRLTIICMVAPERAGSTFTISAN